MSIQEDYSDFLFYASGDGSIKIQVILGEETVWLSQLQISELFQTDRTSIVKHIKNIYETGELHENLTCAKIAQVQMEGKREVKREILYYNLDVIIAVGYRVNSYSATQFRIWATNVLKEYLIKGFILDDERLKQGKGYFGKDYFDELLERIREIRASERRFYQKITDIYQQCSIDYDTNSPITKTFFATVQNKLAFAITGSTAAEIVKSRANANSLNMGLTSWKNEPTGGKIQKSDTIIAKNYLTEKELKDLTAVVNGLLEYAESQARRKKEMKMADWVDRVDAFLQFNEYDVLKDAGSISHQSAVSFAEQEYEKFRITQDQNYESDFDKLIKTTVKDDTIPIAKTQTSNFDEQLKRLLKAPPNIDKE